MTRRVVPFGITFGVLKGSEPKLIHIAMALSKLLKLGSFLHFYLEALEPKLLFIILSLNHEQ